MSIDIYSLYDSGVQMERKSATALVCPQTHLVYPVLRGVPIALQDNDLRLNCYHIDKRMENDGVFDREVPCPSQYDSDKHFISYPVGMSDLLRFQIGHVARHAPRAFVQRLLRKLQGLPWRRTLEEVQTGYEGWDLEGLYSFPNVFFLGIENGRFFRWNGAYISHRIVSEVTASTRSNAAKRILDVGCGYGMQLLQISQALQSEDSNIQLYGMDMTYSRVACSHLLHRQHNQNGQPVFFVGDARFIPYPDDYFDIGYTVYVFEVMPRKILEHAMFEMLRVCKKVVLLEPLKSVQSIFGKLYAFLFDLGGVYIDFLDRNKYRIGVEPFNFDYKNNGSIIKIEKTDAFYSDSQSDAEVALPRRAGERAGE